MTVGPIQFIAIGFEDFTPRGEIMRELNTLRQTGLIRLIDAKFVGKDQGGQITSLDMSGLSEDEAIEFGAVIGGLIGLGAGGAVGAEVGALEGALAATERSFGLNMADVQEIADGLRPGQAAAMLLIEHTWATGFRNAAMNAGGRTLAQGFLTPQALLLVGAELQAQAEAVRAIELSDTIKIEAAREAARAIALSEAIKAEAAREAVEALVTAELIEEAAFEEAANVVIAALAIEQAAIEEAAETLAEIEAQEEAAEED